MTYTVSSGTLNPTQLNPTQRSSFLYCVFQHILFVLLFSLLLHVKLHLLISILLRQNAVISFDCRSVTITCCNSTATCAPMFSLTAGIHALLCTNLQAIPENSGTKVTKRRHHRQPYRDKSSVSHLAFSSRLQVASQSHFLM